MIGRPAARSTGHAAGRLELSVPARILSATVTARDASWPIAFGDLGAQGRTQRWRVGATAR